MNVAFGRIYRAPVDYNEGTAQYFSSDGQELSMANLRDTDDPEYLVNRQGKVRPVLVIGHDRETNRVLVVPLYSQKESGRLKDHYEQQQQEYRRGERYAATLVSVPKSEVIARKVGISQERGLRVNSIARLDEIRALAASDLLECLGEVQVQRQRVILAGYIYSVDGARLQEVLITLKKTASS